MAHGVKISFDPDIIIVKGNIQMKKKDFKEKRYTLYTDYTIEEWNDILKKNIIEPTEENQQKYRNEAVFMGKVGGKKFYFYHKPAYIKNTSSFVTKLSGSLSEANGKTKIRWYYSKFFLSFAILSVVTSMFLIGLFVLFTHHGVQGEEWLWFLVLLVCSLLVNFGYYAFTKASRNVLKNYLDSLLEKKEED